MYAGFEWQFGKILRRSLAIGRSFVLLIHLYEVVNGKYSERRALQPHDVQVKPCGHCRSLGTLQWGEHIPRSSVRLCITFS